MFQFAALLLTLIVSIVPPSPGAAAAEPAYVLGTGDRLRITVHEKPDLSGEFAVGPGGGLSLPVVGRLPAGGMTLAELEAALADRFMVAAGIRDPRIAVEIVEYRPFFIIGAVETAGQYPYVNGMTVLHAITIAGGFRRGESQDVIVQLEAARARERIQTARQNIAVAYARRARLYAERDQRHAIDFPPALADFASPERVVELTANETRVLEQRTQSLEAERALFEVQKTVLGEEITALEGQLASKGKLIEFVQQETAEIEKLRQRDLVPLTRILALRRSATELEADRRQLIAHIARAKQEIARVDLQILNTQRSRSIQIAESIKQADDDLAQHGVTLRGAEDQLAKAEAMMSRTTVQPVFSEQNGEVRILRREASGAKEIRAADDTPVLPGDVIKVPSRPPSPAYR
ncbi:MAG: polysaccharide biosynthesis/export family protein [Alphaproteobacteria bacterium]|nr:polysaccharide biosynthesis/export family protein [Alphaproteobacteria bacterium]